MQLRLDKDRDDFDGVYQYFREYAIQLYSSGYHIRSIEEVSNLGGLATFRNTKGEVFHSFYLYKRLRGKGIYRRLVESENWNILVNYNSELLQYHTRKKVPFVLTNPHLTSYEYIMLEKHYHNEYDNITDRHYMSRVDDALAILTWLGVSDTVKESYLLQPYYYSDYSFKMFSGNSMRSMSTFGIDANKIVNAMEFRHTSLSFIPGGDFTKITTSSLDVVNKMLIANRIANKIDFELYFSDHSMKNSFEDYFDNWLLELAVTDNMYNAFKEKLTLKVLENKKVLENEK
jgi:hypothetical protein